MSKKRFWNILIILFTVFFLITALIIVLLFGKDYFIKDNDENEINNVSSSIASQDLPDNPINFEKLKEINHEIYAWIRVPNTNIDYPIAQSASNDEFYLHHNIYGKYEYAGTIYTEKLNSKNFSDPNTVLYGHNMTKGYMFENLHKFQDEDFFKENTEFFIYTPEKILTYTIISAFQYNIYHIMYSFDFQSEEGFAKYLNAIKSPGYKIKNVKNEIDLTTDDKIVTLSTCLGDGKYYRYLVTGVLTNIQQTN